LSYTVSNLVVFETRCRTKTNTLNTD